MELMSAASWQMIDQLSYPVSTFEMEFLTFTSWHLKCRKRC